MNWRCQEFNLGPFAFKVCVLQLSYGPFPGIDDIPWFFCTPSQPCGTDFPPSCGGVAVGHILAIRLVKKVMQGDAYPVSNYCDYVSMQINCSLKCCRTGLGDVTYNIYRQYLSPKCKPGCLLVTGSAYKKGSSLLLYLESCNPSSRAGWEKLPR